MGKMESTKTSIFSQIKQEIQCPLCGTIISQKASFIELNFHLYYCGKEKVICNKTNIYLNNIRKGSHDIIPYKLKSETKRTKEINNNSELITNSLNDDFQLVIDYNDNAEEDIYEEHLKKKRKFFNSKEKYLELRNFISKKKSQMNYQMTIECNSFSQMFKAFKEINIYYNVHFIYEKKNSEKRQYSLNYVVNKYIKTMIKFKRFEVFYEDNILSFSFSNKKVDFEIIGVIFAILFIYPQIKIKYKFPLILFKMLINQRITLNDIKYENKKLYENLTELISCEDVSKLNLFYTYEGNELILGGAKVKITQVNSYDYVEKVVNYEMNKFKKEINIMKNAIYQFIPKKLIFSFTAEEIEQIINQA